MIEWGFMIMGRLSWGISITPYPDPIEVTPKRNSDGMYYVLDLFNWGPYIQVIFNIFGRIIYNIYIYTPKHI
jgi:hypothetical protein